MLLGVMPLLHRQANLLAQGHLTEMAQAFVFPLPVQVEERLTVLRDLDEFVEALGAYRSNLLAQGATAFVPHLGAVELPRGGRFRAWVGWEHRMRGSAPPLWTSAIYYLRRRADRSLVIEMTDHAAPHALDEGRAEALRRVPA